MFAFFKGDYPFTKGGERAMMAGSKNPIPVDGAPSQKKGRHA
jgi:hypothetical protein